MFKQDLHVKDTQDFHKLSYADIRSYLNDSCDIFCPLHHHHFVSKARRATPLPGLFSPEMACEKIRRLTYASVTIPKKVFTVLGNTPLCQMVLPRSFSRCDLMDLPQTGGQINGID